MAPPAPSTPVPDRRAVRAACPGMEAVEQKDVASGGAKAVYRCDHCAVAVRTASGSGGEDMGTGASSDTRLDPPPQLQQAGAYAAPVATCDVVMKGGITSGIVYPWAVCDLATRYRLVNVGGASAGAIAAAAAAAAEYGRTQGGGFPVLAGLPGQLGAQTKGQSLLFSLFQPQRRTAPLFALLATSLGGEGGGSRTRLALHGLRAAASARGGWLRLGLGALLGLVLLVAA